MRFMRNQFLAVFACCFSLSLAAAAPRERLAISFPIWALYDMGPGGNFADPDRAMAELKARGFNALRFDDGAGLFATTNGIPRGKVALHPPFGPFFSPQIRQMCVVSNPQTVDVRENLVKICRAARKAGVKVILSSWFYLHTYWMTDEAINRELIDGLDTAAKLDYFADEHNRALALLRANGLIDTVAFVELLNEFDGLPFTARYGWIDDAKTAEYIRDCHEKAIAKMKKANPDVLFGYDAASVRIQENLVPRNADVLNFHHYYYWCLYREAFEHGCVKSVEGEIPIPAETAAYLVAKPHTVADALAARGERHRAEVRQSNWNSYVRLYTSIDPKRIPALEKTFAETFAANSARYLKSLEDGVASVVRIRDNVLPGALIVMGEGGAYCPANALLAEEHCDGVWAMLLKQSEILRTAGLWGTVARTPSGPEDPSWKLRADDYRKINLAFRTAKRRRADSSSPSTEDLVVK